MNFIFNILVTAMLFFHRGFADRPCNAGDQIRHFSTLDDLRANDIPFTVGNPRFKGNIVQLDEPIISKLEKNSFICETCDFIVALNLTSHKIEKIEDGAFETLRCLKNLTMDDNEIFEIRPKIFEDIRRLEVLQMRRNNLEVLKNKTFQWNRHLRVLDLSSNNIQNIELLAFFGLQSLETLNLVNNDIITLKFDIFINLPKLYWVNLSNNRIARLEPPTGKEKIKITTLDLSENQLVGGIDHIPLPLVTLLLLAGNNIKLLDINALKKNCPKLVRITLKHNLWECTYLSDIEVPLQLSHIDYDGPLRCLQNPNDKMPADYFPQFLDQEYNLMILLLVAGCLIFVFLLFYIYDNYQIHQVDRHTISNYMARCRNCLQPRQGIQEEDAEEQRENIALVEPLNVPV